jgi:small-conductance mechanosensitive channel
LLAGVQIAISQPIKIGDIVIVEEQFGTIGEITLTYIVINTWDEKRLIVPINYFLEHPFQNWTRMSPEVIGQVKVYADYTLPVATVRQKFREWLESTPLWDKRSAGLQVTGANDKTIEIRATMSARNSSDSYDLECFIREHLITFIQENYPGALPTSRLHISNGAET